MRPTKLTIRVTEVRRSRSARAHILGWMLLLAGIAIATLVLVTARILFAQLHRDARRELTHEAAKFQTFARQDNPATGQPFSDIETLFSSYLTHNLPNTNETFFSIIEGQASMRSAAQPPARLDLDTDFVAHAATVRVPTWGTSSTPAGPIYYGVFPARSEPKVDRGALVVIEFQHDARAQVITTIRLLTFVGLGSWVLAGAIGWFIAGRVLAPIREVRRTADAINESDLGARIDVTGNDDVAELAETFNRMLDRVESAFDAQRAFLDDAGHELRTPITIIRGHLELVESDPDERERTNALVLSELDRMGRIVDDLLLLAKAERPDFLVLGPVELTDLVMTVLANVQHLGDRQWSAPRVADVTVLADGQRLTQALTQLVANAVAHTIPGDAIEISSQVEGDRVRLSVTDTGMGIPIEEQKAIFTRFTRGSTPVQTGGVGLGLAIVLTITHAHGGVVRLVSEEGRGSTFTLDLPFHRTGEAAP